MKHWLMIGCLLLSLPARAEQPSEHIQAYVFGLRAEQAEAAGKLEEALKLYSESLRYYQETARANPDWNTTAVLYRINTTGNEIERIKQRITTEAGKRTAQTVATHQQEIDQLVAEAKAVWTQEQQQLVGRIAELQTTLDEEIKAAGDKQIVLDKALARETESRTRLTAVEQELEQATSALASAGQRVEELEGALAKNAQALAAAGRQALDLADRDAAIQRLGSENEELKKLVDQLQSALRDRQAEIDRLTKIAAEIGKVDKLKDERDELKKEIKELSRQLKEDSERLAAGEKANADLERRLEAAQKEAAVARQSVETARKESGNALQEVEVLNKALEAGRKELDSSRQAEARVADELAAALKEIERIKREPVGDAAFREREARFERAEVENIVFREVMATLSNRLQQLSAQNANASDRLALEQKKWNAERVRLVEKIDALKETVDINRADVEKNKELRSMIKDLEKENQRLSKRPAAANPSPDDAGRWQERIAELEAQIESLQGRTNSHE